VGKLQEWLNEKAPSLSGIFENKYVGMVYDRFASLPPTQQRRVTIASFTGIVILIVAYLLYSLFSLWLISSRAADVEDMIGMLQKYKSESRSKSAEMSSLSPNNLLARKGALRRHLQGQGRTAQISPRSIRVDETEVTKDTAGKEKDVRVKQANVKLERVNLDQLLSFLRAIEHGSYALSISSLKVTNDNKVRGYMNVDMGIVAYLFEFGEEG